MKEAMKINIIEDRCIKTRYLNREINYFLCERGYEPILLMNNKTAEGLKKELEKYINFIPNESAINKGYIGKYAGDKIFIDNDLVFGEVEIR